MMTRAADHTLPAVIKVPPLERCVSVGVGVAAAGAGLAISLLVPRRIEIIGAVITTGGLMLIDRGITGRDTSAAPPAMH